MNKKKFRSKIQALAIINGVIYDTRHAKFLGSGFLRDWSRDKPIYIYQKKDGSYFEVYTPDEGVQSLRPVNKFYVDMVLTKNESFDF